MMSLFLLPLGAFRTQRWMMPFCFLSFILAAHGQKSFPPPGGQQSAVSISGYVIDPNGNPIMGATITLIDAVARLATMTTGEDGTFNLPAGPDVCDLQFSAPGFSTKSIHREMCAGRPLDVGKISLALEAGATEVVVSASRQEIAQEQIKFEMSQRILGIVPNFFVTYDPKAVPLSPKQKFTLAGRTLIDPETIGVDLGLAAVQQKTATLRGFGAGVGGFTKQFAASYGTGSIDTLLGSAILPSIFKQDPRYFYKGTGSVSHRALYAISMSVLCKGDDGRWQFNYSGLLGGVAAGTFANLYEARNDRHGMNVTLSNSALGIGSSAVSNLLQEFVIKRFVRNSR